MNATDKQARLTAGLEALGQLRERAIAGRPINRDTFEAAIGIVAGALDEDSREALREALPATKASLGVDELGTINLIVAVALMAATPAAKGATKGSLWVRPAPYDPHAAAADRLRATIASEDRADKARAEADSDAAWVDTWMEHGRRRSRLVRLLAGAMAR